MIYALYLSTMDYADSIYVLYWNTNYACLITIDMFVSFVSANIFSPWQLSNGASPTETE